MDDAQNYFATVARGPCGFFYKFRVTAVDAQGNISSTGGVSKVVKARDTMAPVVDFGYGFASDYSVVITKSELATDIWDKFSISDAIPSSGVVKAEWFFEIRDGKQTWDWPSNQDFHTINYFNGSESISLNCNREIVTKAPWYPTRNKFVRAGTYRILVRAYDKDGNFNTSYAWQTYQVIASDPYKLVFADESSLRFDVLGKLVDYTPLTRDTNYRAPFMRAGETKKFYVVSADKDFDIVTTDNDSGFVRFDTSNAVKNDCNPMASVRIYQGLETGPTTTEALKLTDVTKMATVEPAAIGVNSMWSKGMITVVYYETRDINTEDGRTDMQIIVSSPSFSQNAMADIEIRPNVFHHLKFDNEPPYTEVKTAYKFKADEGVLIGFDRRDEFDNLIYSSADTEAVAVNFINEHTFTIDGDVASRYNYHHNNGKLYWNSKSGVNSSEKAVDDEGWFPWEVASAETEPVGIALGSSGNLTDGHVFKIEGADYSITNTTKTTYFVDGLQRIKLISTDPGRPDRYNKHQFILSGRKSSLWYNDTLATGETKLTAYIYGFDTTESKF
ncbi:MAG: hypothetical protein ACD_47C00592G0001, partial [uncultured bacterium]